MAEVIKCVHCGAVLRLREEYIDQEVQCPSCQETFTARLPAERPEAAARRPVELAPRRPIPLEQDRPPLDFNEPPRDLNEWEEYRLARRRRAYQEMRRQHTRVEPHRGGTILAIGIVSLFLFCAPAVGIALGVAAALMAHNDLAKMHDGFMDPSGEGQTRTGQVCGILGVVVTALSFGCFILFAVLRHAK
jgi:hypothetical protein